MADPWSSEPPSLPPDSFPSLQPGSSASLNEADPQSSDESTLLATRVKRVRAIVREQFGSEVNYKESELEVIEDRIHLAKMMLQRLRLGVLAQHYGVAAFFPTALDYREETIGEQHNWEMFEELLIRQDQGEGSTRQDMGEGSTRQEVEEGSTRPDLEEGSTQQDLGEMVRREEASQKEVFGSVKEKGRVVTMQGSAEMEQAQVESRTGGAGMGAEKVESQTVLGGASVGGEKQGNTAEQNHVLQAVAMETSPTSLPVDTPTTDECPVLPHKDPSLCRKAPDHLHKDPPFVTRRGVPPAPHIGPSLDPSKDHSDVGCEVQESRFYLKKRVIVGNTSQYLDPTAHHSKGDGSTHKWMVYVRGPPAEPSISHFVKAVRFFLHPSYHPNDIVHVRKPPFHLTRLGWGEFPVRVQLEFCDRYNKSVDIIHNLVLDRTHTGQQTLGAETVVDLDIAAPPPGSEKTFRMNGVSISSMTVKHGDDKGPDGTDPPPLPPLSPINLPPESMDHDGSTPPSTPTMWSGQTTPLSAGGMGVLTTNLDKCLHAAARNIPIYGKANPTEEFYIPAPSLAQFRLWHIGRRRATEWERAVAIRKSIEVKLKLPSLLSTKQVMQWCRQNGYTPLDPVPAGGRGFCKVCGCQLAVGLEEEEDDWGDDGEDEGSEGMGVARKCPEVHEHCQILMFGRHGLPLRGNTLDPFEELQPNYLVEEEGVASLPKLCSLSQPHDLVAKVLSQQGRLEDKAKKQEEDVDVCFLPASPSCARSRALVDMVPRFRVPQTPELKWVQQRAASVGIHIYPAVIDRMYAHVVEHMIYISCTRFLRGILAQAVQGAGQMLDGKLSQDRVLTPFHVQQAILKLEHCDFLTNQYTGVKLRLEGRDGNGTSESSSSSCSSSDEGEGP